MLRISANSTIRGLDVRLWRPSKAKEDVRTEVWRWHITLWMQFVDQRYYCRNSQHRKHIFMENKIRWITVIQLEISPYPFQIWNIKFGFMNLIVFISWLFIVTGCVDLLPLLLFRDWKEELQSNIIDTQRRKWLS